MRGEAGFALLAAALLAAGAAGAGDSSGAVLADRFTAKTTAMTPRDVPVRVDVRTWPDEAARAAVVEALAAQTDADAAKALQALPTVGYVWQGDSPVGYALKYANRTPTADGERVTFVTDRRLGAYELKQWALDAPGSQKPLAYSVIELYLDSSGKGDGNLSLAAAPKVDAEQHTVTLAADDQAPHVLTDAKHEPKGYSPKGR
jgi:hypothetical protein